MQLSNFRFRMPKIKCNERGQALVEYSFLWSVFSGALLVSLAVFTTQVNQYFEDKTAELEGRAATQIAESNPTPDDECDSSSGNGNNGHGNNSDGVDSSNPGNGKGGPNGGEDPSGEVDDENKGNQNGNSGSADCDEQNNNNGNGNNGNGNNEEEVILHDKCEVTAEDYNNGSYSTLPVAIVNGGFESPTFYSSYGHYPAAYISGWSTTERQQTIEVWRSGFYGVPAYAGNQFAEINSHDFATLYQDVDTLPGAIMTWQFAHRGRAGNDSIRLLIGSPDGPSVSQGVFTTGIGGWQLYSGIYTVPEGQESTRFSYEAVHAAGGISIGNFLDDIQFSIAVCPD